MMTKNQPVNVRSTQKVRSQNNTNIKKKKRRNNRNGNVRRSTVPCFNLSRCSANYAKVKLDPFNYMDNELPCIPDLFDLPSQKIATITRGTFSTGTLGFGALLVAADCHHNDYNVAWATTQSYAGSTTPSVSNATVLGIKDSRYPYPIANPRLHRTVATAVRVRYIGSELDKGGRLVAWTRNGTGNSPNSLTLDELWNLAEGKSFNVDRKWKTISWNPGYPEAYSFRVDSYGLGTGTPANANFMIAYSGASGKTAFEWERIQYHEMISNGVDTVTAETKSHSDLPGMSVVRDFLSSDAIQDVGANAFQQFLTYAKSAAVTAATSYIGVPNPEQLLLKYL